MGSMGNLISQATSQSQLTNLLESDKFGIYAASTYLACDGVTDDYADLYTLINTTINGADAEIWFKDGTCLIGSNITIPSNIKLKFLNGGVLKPANGVAITGSNARIEAGLHQIFDLSLGGTLAGVWDVQEIFIEWFGAKSNANYYSGGKWYEDSGYTIEANDDSNAIQYLINSISAFPTVPYGGCVRIQSRTLYDTININKQGITFIGQHANKSMLVSKSATSLISITEPNINFEKVGFYGLNKTNDGIEISSSGGNVKFDKCKFLSFDVALKINARYYNSVYNTLFDTCTTGIYLTGVGGANANYIGQNSRFSNCGTGVKIDSGTLNTITDSTFEDITTYGVQISGTSYKTEISGNYFEVVKTAISLGNSNRHFIGINHFSTNRVVNRIVDSGNNSYIFTDNTTSDLLSTDTDIGVSNVTITVTDGTLFEGLVGSDIIITDDDNQITREIATVVGNDITVTVAMTNDFYTSKNAYVQVVDETPVQYFGKHKTYLSNSNNIMNFGGGTNAVYRYMKNLIIEPTISFNMASDLSTSRFSISTGGADNKEVYFKVDGTTFLTISAFDTWTFSPPAGGNFIIKNLTATAKDATAPEAGMIAYESNHFYGYNGSTWLQLDNP